MSDGRQPWIAQWHMGAMLTSDGSFFVREDGAEPWRQRRRPSPRSSSPSCDWATRQCQAGSASFWEVLSEASLSTNSHLFQQVLVLNERFQNDNNFCRGFVRFVQYLERAKVFTGLYYLKWLRKMMHHEVTMKLPNEVKARKPFRSLQPAPVEHLHRAGGHSPKLGVKSASLPQ